MFRLAVIGLCISVLAGGAGAVTLKDEMHSNISRGNRYYESGDNEMALERYLEAQGLDSTFAVPHFNAGDALYRLGNYKEGAMEYLRSSTAGADSVKAMSYYNLGNTMFKAGDLQSAVEAYKRSLLINPDDRDAKYNLELAVKMQEQQEQQQQNQQQNQQQDQKDQNQGDQEQESRDNQQQDRQEQESQQDQQQQSQEEQTEDQQQQPEQGEEQQPPEISPEELERILAAIEASDKQTQEEMMKKASQRKTVTGKDW
jgi:Ca-activated chloride channel family protein